MLGALMIDLCVHIITRVFTEGVYALSITTLAGNISTKLCTDGRSPAKHQCDNLCPCMFACLHVIKEEAVMEKLKKTCVDLISRH